MIASSCFLLIFAIVTLKAFTEETPKKSSIQVPTVEGCGNRKVATLAFADAPLTKDRPVRTIMKALADQKVTASFFLSPGAWEASEDKVALNHRCKTVKSLVEAGHEVQSEGWQGLDASTLTDQDFIFELDRLSRWIQSCGAPAPNKFRAPLSALPFSKAQILAKKGYTIVFNNAVFDEYKKPNDLTNIMQKLSSNGLGSDSLVLNLQQVFTYKIVGDLITKLKSAGYQFVSTTDCYAKCDTKDAFGICRTTKGQMNFQIINWDIDLFKGDDRSSRCGRSWAQAQTKCGLVCDSDWDCDGEDSCFQDLSIRPCFSS